MQLTFLGTGAGSGVPAFYCRCPICEEAMEDPRCRRTRCAICISGQENILFDAPPELSYQLRRERIDKVDCLFITHEHHDHSAGLGDIALYAKFSRRCRLPAMMSAQTLHELEKSHGPMEEWLDVTLLEPGQTIERAGLEITALEVSHSPGCLGYLVASGGRRTAYLPDTGPLPQSTKARLRRVDDLILDCTFWGENWYPDDHLSFDQTIQTAEEIDAGTLYLTHLSMHYSQPITSREIEHAIAPHGGRVKLAYDGMRVMLGSKASRATSDAALVAG